MPKLSIFLTAVMLLLDHGVARAESDSNESRECDRSPLGVGVSLGLVDFELAAGLKASKGILGWWEMEINAQRTGLAFNETITPHSFDEIPSYLIGLDNKFYLASSFYLLGGVARNIPVDHKEGFKKAPPTNRYHVAIGNKWDLSDQLFLDVRWAGWYDGAGRQKSGGDSIRDFLNLGIGLYLK